jgi:hypothetical protein
MASYGGGQFNLATVGEKFYQANVEKNWRKLKQRKQVRPLVFFAHWSKYIFQLSKAEIK